jgi:hypothetical protein
MFLKCEYRYILGMIDSRSSLNHDVNKAVSRTFKKVGNRASLYALFTGTGGKRYSRICTLHNISGHRAQKTQNAESWFAFVSIACSFVFLRGEYASCQYPNSSDRRKRRTERKLVVGCVVLQRRFGERHVR